MFRRAYDWLAEHPAAAYSLALLVFLKRIWMMWTYRDLTSGDTSSYFHYVHNWIGMGLGNIAWSPLYTWFYSLVFRATGHAWAATLTHRIIILTVLVVLVVAIFRRVATPWMAWLAAVWWIILPVDFDTFYEVHLFSAILPLAAVLIALHLESHTTRAAIFALLFVNALLVRNEYMAAAGLFAVYSCFRLYRERPPVRLLAPYAAAVVIPLAMLGVFYAKSFIRGPVVSEVLRDRHGLNTCQIFAFSYQQRDPTYKESPWTACQQLMKSKFGSGLPSFREAAFANPAEIASHLAFQITLIPAGIERALFGQSGPGPNPDFEPTPINPLAHTVLIALAAALAAACWRLRGRWREAVPAVSSQTLALAFSLLVLGVIICLTQRPRTAYMFPQQVMLMGAVAVAADQFVARRVPGLQRLFPILAALVLLLVSPYTDTWRQRGTPLARMYSAFLPHRDRLPPHRPVVVGAPYFNTELTLYWCGWPYQCQSVPLPPEQGGSFGFLANLTAQGVQVVYLDPNALARKDIQEWIATERDWETLGFESGSNPWRVMWKVR